MSAMNKAEIIAIGSDNERDHGRNNILRAAAKFALRAIANLTKSPRASVAEKKPVIEKEIETGYLNDRS
jgi:hypothetical protein